MSSRCKACNSSMQYAPFWVTLQDGTRLENDLCSRCNYLGTSLTFEAPFLDSTESVIQRAKTSGVIQPEDWGIPEEPL